MSADALGPPGERSRAPHQKPGADTTIDTVIVAQPADIPTQLRRRRKASYRQPRLADGRRDPLDKPRNRPIEWRAIGKNTVEFRGADGAVYLAIHNLGVRFMRAPRGGAWYVHEASADDVAALLETRGYDLRAVL